MTSLTATYAGPSSMSSSHGRNIRPSAWFVSQKGFSLTPRNGQEQSILFKLPPELREMVYHHALGNDMLNIYRTPKISGYDALYKEQEPDGLLVYTLRARQAVIPGLGYASNSTHMPELWPDSALIEFAMEGYSNNRLGLSLSCSRIYYEAHRFLYSSNVFEFYEATAQLGFRDIIPANFYHLVTVIDMPYDELMLAFVLESRRYPRLELGSTFSRLTTIRCSLQDPYTSTFSAKLWATMLGVWYSPVVNTTESRISDLHKFLSKCSHILTCLQALELQIISVHEKVHPSQMPIEFRSVFRRYLVERGGEKGFRFVRAG